MKCPRAATDTPSHGPGPAPLGDSPEAQAGARGTEEGTGGESKEEEKKGQPGPFSGKIPGAIVHFSAFCTARPPGLVAELPPKLARAPAGRGDFGPSDGGYPEYPGYSQYPGYSGYSQSTPKTQIKSN